MNKEQLIQFLRDELSVDLSFSRYTYCGNNELKLVIKIGSEEIYQTTVTIDPAQDKEY